MKTKKQKEINYDYMWFKFMIMFVVVFFIFMIFMFIINNPVNQTLYKMDYCESVAKYELNKSVSCDNPFPTFFANNYCHCNIYENGIKLESYIFQVLE